MKLLALILATTLVALQYPLWFGKGGWLRVHDLQQQVDAQKAVTARLEARNRAFDAEVRDLKNGYDALEERARSELGMIRQDELFFQFGPRGSPPPPAPPPTSALPSPSTTPAQASTQPWMPPRTQPSAQPPTASR